MANLPQKLPLDQMQTKWASQLNPLLSNLLTQGQLISNVTLINGSTAVSHKLGRQPQGWFCVSPQGPSGSVYQASQQPNPTLTLTLINDASLTTDLWIF